MKNANQIKKKIVFWANKLYQRHLVVGSCGNLSCELGDDKILISRHNSFLGFMNEEDILLVDSKGKILEGKGELSTELKLHLGILKNLGTGMVIHAHPPFSTAYFSKFKTLKSFSFETRIYLADVPVLPQETPAVTEIQPVIEALKKSNIVVLKNHGVVAIGDSFKETFSLIEILEELAKVNLHTQNFGEEVNIALNGQIDSSLKDADTQESASAHKKYKMFSPEHIKIIVDLVNKNLEIQQKAKELDLTTTLAVKCDETGEVYNFNFQKGYIADITHNDDAEFVISGSKDYWRMIFNRQLDPFAATTQKKLKLKGDFAKLSRWYVPFVKIFEVWREVPVE